MCSARTHTLKRSRVRSRSTCPLRYGTTRRQSSRFNCALLWLSHRYWSAFCILRCGRGRQPTRLSGGSSPAESAIHTHQPALPSSESRKSHSRAMEPTSIFSNRLRDDVDGAASLHRAWWWRRQPPDGGCSWQAERAKREIRGEDVRKAGTQRGFWRKEEPESALLHAMGAKGSSPGE